MIALTVSQLQQIMPRCDAAAYIPYLNPALVEFEINTPGRVAMFLANVAHESSELRVLSENLNYSSQGLRNTWPNRFSSFAVADQYQHQPEKIANYVYANRMGNGDIASGDGFRFRGAGALQLTGKAMQAKMCAYTGVPLEYAPAWLLTPQGAITSAGWFWMTSNLNHYADIDDFDGCCDMINIGHATEKYGDALGFHSRQTYFNTARIALLGG
jgi:putative chitinase